jgi:predicted transcriptional regulator
MQLCAALQTVTDWTQHSMTTVLQPLCRQMLLGCEACRKAHTHPQAGPRTYL